MSQLKIHAISRHEGLKVIFPLLRRIHSLSSFPRKAIILFNAISRVRGMNARGMSEQFDHDS